MSYLGHSFQSRHGILRFPLIVVIKTGSNVISWAFSLAFVLKCGKEMAMANHRIDRVGMEIKREVNDILQKKVRDPRVQGVTITEVQMQGDLSLAKVYYTIMSDLASDNQKAQTGLEKTTGTIKRELGKQLTMYKIPDLVFEKDNSIAYGNKIDQLLRDLDNKS